MKKILFDAINPDSKVDRILSRDFFSFIIRRLIIPKGSKDYFIYIKFELYYGILISLCV